MIGAIAFVLLVWFIGTVSLSYKSMRKAFNEAKTSGYPYDWHMWYSEQSAPTNGQRIGRFNVSYLGPAYPEAHAKFIRFSKSMGIAFAIVQIAGLFGFL